jgi:hypothetical protein
MLDGVKRQKKEIPGIKAISAAAESQFYLLSQSRISHS